eukprot:CAMPEP_0182921304 /NCGR_PEP_ID=MMETSP0105_2-20130417/4063_1 /TAXON_ID=81532 ORGANISM="Acanthoeca-like sp., Strain 10tr" /NCGR_SAMPLE_ID=MMETSP0105_2 /ASSEMBLY_ACC=CAM_ASM_000205 /LENGTH=336 /DNA_ID=CAMNT_0025058811 /DNA_START=30 /DNA_END=1040 /DNA_ORIENTATION=-
MSAMSPVRWLAVVGVAGLAAAQTNLPVSGWPAQWNTSNCTGSTVPASCAEIGNFTFSPQPNGAGYFYSPPLAGGLHSGCSPNGVPNQAGVRTRGCGHATFRVYCERASYVRFSGEVQSGPGGGTDDSFWVYLDGLTRPYYYVRGVPRIPTWSTTTLQGGTQLWQAGAHSVHVVEREDGTRFRRIWMTSGYPDCSFGVPPTTATVLQRVLDLETSTNNRVSALSAAVAALNSTVSTLVASAISSAVTTLRGEMSTQATTAAAVSSAVAGLTARGSALNAFAPGGGYTGAQAKVSSDVQRNVVLQAPGAVTVQAGQCSTDFCSVAAQVQAITDALRGQ